jgi:pyrroloquinoline quinone biosynthesis protein D
MLSMTFTGRLQLSRKARIRLDRGSGRDLLLHPERGLELNSTAGAIARLCTAGCTIDDMVQHLSRTYGGASPVEIKREVVEFLAVLAERGLLQGLP